MYIAGINFGLTHPHTIEGIVAVTTVAQLLVTSGKILKKIIAAEDTAGSVKPIPPSFAAKYISVISTFSRLSAPTLYLIGLGLYRFQPKVRNLGLDFPDALDEMLGVGGKAAVRITACVASVISLEIFGKTMNLIQSQFHYLGVREKAKVVTTGPFAYVRHPLYSSFLLQQLFFAPMFWSYLPLITFCATFAAFTVKIPLEEKLLEEDVELGPSYIAYKDKVRSRLIPCIW